MTRSTPARVATTAAALLSLALVSAPASAVVAAPSPFTALYVFGDSLSDAAGGNFLVPFAPNEGGLPVTAPYDLGRVSNGPVAAEYLGGLLGLSQAQQFHYAIAGARSGANGTIPGVGVAPTGLLTQVGAFAQGGANAAYGGGLFMVWAGANDLRDALQTANPTASFAGILGNLGSAVDTLYALGARNFLLPNMPDLGLTPAAQALGPAASGGASFVTGLFNGVMASTVDGWELAPSLSGSQFYTFDTFAAHNQQFNAAVQQGWNTNNGCLLPVDGATEAMSACNVSFYVDDIHPTTAVHQILGQQMAAAVPEPQTMLLMAGGLVALMGMARRRQRAAA